MGRSRGGLTTKIHALVDAEGRPIRLKLTEGDVDQDAIAGMLEYAGEGLESEGRDARFEAIASTLEDEALRDGVFVVASAVAWKDGGIGEKQGLAVRALGKAFGYSENKLQTLLAKGRHS